VTGFTSKYPPDFKGTVGLDAGKVYAATGTIGRVSFSYNGGGDKDTNVEIDSTPAKPQHSILILSLNNEVVSRLHPEGVAKKIWQ
jgi:hypothetical protein